MDNIFEILIYLFIIISFLSSFFKKKKKTGSEADIKTPEPPLQPESQPRTSQQEEYDLLKEIEKMFKMETPSTEKKEKRSFETERFEPASEHLETTDWHQPTPTEHKTTISEHTVERWTDKTRKVEDKRKAVDEKILKQAQMFEKRLSEKRGRGTETQFKKNIIQKFKEPNSLKEYIIFSEILGKPKAFQE